MSYLVIIKTNKGYVYFNALTGRDVCKTLDTMPSVESFSVVPEIGEVPPPYLSDEIILNSKRPLFESEEEDRFKGGPAWIPGQDRSWLNFWQEKQRELSRDSGRTLRDYFAAKAMQGLIVDDRRPWEYVAKHAYQMADIMLKEREK